MVLSSFSIRTLSIRHLSCGAALLVAGCTGLSAESSDGGTKHVHYIAADEVAWDYAPTGRDQITGIRLDSTALRIDDGPEYSNVKQMDYGAGDPPGLRGIGRVYKKALFREYTDSTFTTLKPRPEEWAHLGFLGPLLRAEVGDTIVVVFRNHASRPYSVHPHGVFYRKDSEGTPYSDETGDVDKRDDAVPPGGTHTYLWPVPERAGPGPNDPSSVLWMYHSHVREDEDINSGLMGPMIVTAAGKSGPEGRPVDVDREFIGYFAATNEGNTWYLDENIETYVPDFPVDSVKAQPFFRFTNEMLNINGWMYGNMPLMQMQVGERVRWYLMGGTNFIDLHNIHWHGHTVTVGGHRTDMIGLDPMMMAVADMEADNPGIWFFHCHVNFHLEGGMSARFQVVEPGATTTASR